MLQEMRWVELVADVVGMLHPKALAVAAKSGRIDAGFKIEIDSLKLIRRTAGRSEKASDVVFIAPLVACTAPDETPPNVAIEVNRLMLAWRLRDVEDEEPAGLRFDNVVGGRHLIANFLARAQCAEQVILHLVESQDTDDLELISLLLNAENQMPAGCIGERGDGFERIARNFIPRGLHFKIRPLIGLDAGQQLVSG